METIDNELVAQLISEGYRIVGSQYFFKGMPDFNPHDYDFHKIVSEEYASNHDPAFHYHYHSHHDGCCVNMTVERPVDEMLNWIIGHDIMVGSIFLIPEVAEQVGFDFAKDHEKLIPVIEYLDSKQKWGYYKIIYEAYVENGSMTLTDEQRQRAYESYLESRKPKDEAKGPIAA